jgi:hypothetical protein
MDQIIFNVRNANNTAAVFISNDPAANAVTLIVNNASGSDLPLRAGAPVMEPPPDGGPSSLYLSFGDFVPGAAIPQIKVEADGWQVKYFSDPAPTFALTPTMNRTFASQSTLSIRISNFPVYGPPRTASIGIDYYGMGTLDDSSGIGSVVVQNKPRGDKPLQLDRNIVSNPVAFITVDQSSPIKNTLVFHFSNPSPTEPLVDDKTKWKSDPPEFLISFVPGKPPGYGALTTLERMKDIEIGLAQVYQDGWSVTKDTSGPKPVWRLKPKTHEVLGTGEAATVEFRITDLVTELKAGLSLLYVQYINIPGFEDGYFVFQIEKRMPSPGILQFISLTPAVIKRGDPITLAWQTFDAASLTLSYAVNDRSYRRTAPVDVPFNGSYSPVPAPSDDLTYSLEVFDYANNKVQQQVTITVVGPPKLTAKYDADQEGRTYAGATVLLQWDMPAEGDTVAVTKGTKSQSTVTLVNGQPPAGTCKDVLQETTDYQVSAQGVDPGQTTVRVAPVGATLSSDKAETRIPGSPVVLTSTVQFPSSYAIKPDVFAAGAGSLGEVRSFTVYPLQDTTYTLEAVGFGGPARSSRGVSVRTKVGSFSTSDVRSWDKPQATNTKRIGFSSAYASAPTIATGLSQLDVARLRISAEATAIDAAGFTAGLNSWADSTLYSATSTWLAIAAGDPAFQVGQFNTAEDHPWNQPKMQTSRRIKFTRAYPGSAPRVVVWLNALDISGPQNVRVNASVTDIDSAGFTVHIDAWGDTVLYSAGVTWIAFPANLPGVVSGSFNTSDVRPWNQPRAETSGTVTFPGGSFAGAPLVVLALNMMDMGGTNRRIVASASEITPTGFRWNLNTWSDTILYSAGAQYIAMGRTAR